VETGNKALAEERDWWSHTHMQIISNAKEHICISSDHFIELFQKNK